MTDLNNLTAEDFNFDALKDAIGSDPFAKQSRFQRDERFYVLSKDKNGNGAALIRFLPDSEKRMIIEMQKIGTTITKGDKKRFVNKFSPATIGLPCPFQEEWARRWNSGDKEGSKPFSRSIRYVTNIKILKDPANPENEGKIFLYEMSGAMRNKLEKALNPSEQDVALGKTPKQLFNPLKGNSFRLVAQKGSNGQINYDASEVVAEETSIYNSVEEAIKDIKENTYKLGDLLKPEAFDSYETLLQDFKRVTFQDMDESTPQATPVDAQAEPAASKTEPAASKTEPEVSQAEPAAAQAEPEVSQAEPEVSQTTKSDDLDSILQGLV